MDRSAQSRSPNDTCKRTPSVVSMMALMVAFTILPPDRFTCSRSPTLHSGIFRSRTQVSCFAS